MNETGVDCGVVVTLHDVPLCDVIGATTLTQHHTSATAVTGNCGVHLMSVKVLYLMINTTLQI